MSILYTGKGTSGSWVIRGMQVGKAMRADVVKRADSKTMSQYAVVVVVKRVTDEMLANLQDSARPWIWDVVDAWPQPEGNAWSRQQAESWLRGELRRLRPDGVVFPTTRMWEDSGWSGPALVLPHHAKPDYYEWSGTPQHKLRSQVQIVGYEGAPHYLGSWMSIVSAECRRRGWWFEINCDLRNADIGVALRDCAGYPSPAWKSNVKLANLQALGLPALCSIECGYQQFSSDTEQWIQTPEDVRRAFDIFADPTYRASVRERAMKSTITLGRVRHEMLTWLKVSRFF